MLFWLSVCCLFGAFENLHTVYPCQNKSQSILLLSILCWRKQRGRVVKEMPNRY